MSAALHQLTSQQYESVSVAPVPVAAAPIALALVLAVLGNRPVLRQPAPAPAVVVAVMAPVGEGVE